MKKLSKLGIENIVAIILFVVIAAIVTLVVYSWQFSYITRTLSYVGEESQEIEEIYISGVRAINTSVGLILEVLVKNIGNVVVNVTKVYIIDLRLGKVVCNKCVSILLTPGETTPIAIIQDVDCANKLKSDVKYLVKVMSKKGTMAEYVFKIYEVSS